MNGLRHSQRKPFAHMGAFALGLVVLPGVAQSVVSEDGRPIPAWIWLAASAQENQAAYFRKAFTTPSAPMKAVLFAACDDRLRVFINGRLMGEIEGFQQATSLDVTGQIRPGENVVAIEAHNDAGAAGLGLLIEFASARGIQSWLATDASWLCSPKASAGWRELDFPAQGWAPAFSHGVGDVKPWGNPFDVNKAIDAYNSWKLALGSGTATAAATLSVPPGFRAELVRSAQPEEGSWVCLAFDPKGRLILAREKRGLLRMTFDRNTVSKVELINDTLLECRGLLYAHDSLYANANNSKGLYRLRDTDGDDQFDEVKLLLQTEGGVGHGRNQAVLGPGPDNSIYLVHGNDVRLTDRVAADSPHRNYAEDQLIPCPWDEHWFNAEVRAPGGHILGTDAEGNHWRVIAGGFRNPLDLAFNRDGEMFTYDADMERDIGTPWYRPTRINHVVSGGEYGWRRGTGKWPAYYADSLPSTHDIGVGSPTGIEFGYASHFPPTYREALFICDWAYGRIIAVHLKPQGASYTGTSEPFLTGRPLNVTDVKFGPDGAMYFITGGRGTQSGLYRVNYVGSNQEEKPASAAEQAEAERARQARALRHRLESFHTRPGPGQDANAVAEIWPYLGHEDFWIRYAARIALEQQDVKLWQTRALAETNRESSLTALLALARVGQREAQRPLVEKLNRLPLSALNEAEQLHAWRLYAVAFARHGVPDPDVAAACRTQLDALYPSARRAVNHELCELLVYLKSPSVIAKTVDLLARAEASEDLLQYLFFLRYVRDGWTLAQRRTFFEALRRADRLQGARDYYSSLRNLRAEVVASLTTEERQSLAALLEATPPNVALVSAPPLPLVKEWQLSDFDLDQMGLGRSFEAGRAAFQAAQCVACHRCGSDVNEPGGNTGPDLTAVASRFGRRDLLESILQPSKVIDDKFRNIVFHLQDGSIVVGSVEREDDKTVVVRADPRSEETTELARQNIQRRELSDVSPMPAGLLNGLQQTQVLDLLAYLESGGNAAHALFQPRRADLSRP